MSFTVAKLTVATLAVGLLALGWWWFAPTSLGGKDTYVVVSGPSMEPLLTTGDLVVLRQASRYQAGEIAGYRTPQLAAPIVHRIIAARGGRFSFRGVNNAFVDPSHPTSREILGRMVANLGTTGRLLRILQQPVIGGLLLGATGVVASVPVRRHRRRQREQRRRRSHGHTLARP